MFAVEVNNLRKEFFRRDATRTHMRRRRRRVAALEGVTFTMERGECVAILGQNGSGKSTLVRLLSTLLLPDGGSARIFGHDVVKESRPVQRLVNRVSVEASFFKKMSSEENLAYAARFYGIPPSVTKTAIPEILERVGFPAGRRHEPMENLSRGMQQRTALARALRRHGPRSKLEVQDFIRDVWTSHDATILLCTHDLREAEVLADRVGILDRGRLIALDPAEVLKEQHDVETLEEAFFAATGRAFEEEEDEDAERGVFA